MLSGMVNDLGSHALACRSLLDALVFVFQRIDGLAEIAGMACDMDPVSHTEGALIDLNDGNTEMRIIMSDRSDGLF